MSWFNRKPKTQPIVVQPPAQSRVEIELHKNASENEAHKAAEVNEHLKDLLGNSDVTLKIYLAAGGHPPKKMRESS